MNRLNTLHKELKQFHNFEVTPVNIIRYLHHLETIVKHKSPTSLPYLFSQFRDDPQYYKVLETLKHMMERYYSEKYVQHVLKNLDSVCKHAPEWACKFLFDLFQTPTYRREFQEYIHLANTSIAFLETLEKRLLLHKALIQELRSNLTHKDAVHA